MASRVILLLRVCLVSTFVARGIASSSSSASPKNDTSTELPLPMLVSGALLWEITWVRPRGYIALIAIAPNWYYPGYYPNPQDLRHPAELGLGAHETTAAPSRHHKNLTCARRSADSGNSHVDGITHIAHCFLPEALHAARRLTLTFPGAGVVSLGPHLNAHGSLGFHPLEDVSSSSSSTTTTTSGGDGGGGVGRRGRVRVAVAIKAVQQYSHWTLEIVQHYERQGFSHVYLGVDDSGSSCGVGDKCDFKAMEEGQAPSWSSATVLPLYERLLAPYVRKGFVSVGGIMRSPHFIYRRRCRWDTQKMLHLNAVMYHAKASGEDALAVVDMDEVIFPAQPSVLVADAFSSFLAERSPNSDAACFVIMKTYYSVPTNYTKQYVSDSASLSANYAARCTKRSHPKSVALLRNANYSSLHMHDKTCAPVQHLDVGDDALVVAHLQGLWEAVHTVGPKTHREGDLAVRFSRLIPVETDCAIPINWS